MIPSLCFSFSEMGRQWILILISREDAGKGPSSELSQTEVQTGVPRLCTHMT